MSGKLSLIIAATQSEKHMEFLENPSNSDVASNSLPLSVNIPLIRGFLRFVAGVPAAMQKVMFKGKNIKDNDINLATVAIYAKKF